MRAATAGPCVFIQDVRDAMQRVVEPAEVAIYHISGESNTPSEHGVAPIPFGQEADLAWSPTGSIRHAWVFGEAVAGEGEGVLRMKNVYQRNHISEANN